MTAKERIMAIRLIEKAEQNPAYAQQIGVSAKIRKTDTLTTHKKEVI